MLRTRILRALVVLTASAVASTLMTPAAWAAEAAASPGDEGAFAQAVNQIRAENGLRALQIDAQLSDIARNWSFSMAAAGDISHRSDLRDGVTSRWTALGENVGVGPNVTDLINAFVNSPGHYKNLVDPRFTHLGTGAVTVDGVIYTAHEFAAIEAAPASAAPKSELRKQARSSKHRHARSGRRSGRRGGAPRQPATWRR